MKRVSLVCPSIGGRQDPKTHPDTAKLISSLPFQMNNYRFEQLIGAGSFSVVFRVFHTQYNRYFAAKLTATRSADHDKSVTSEADILVELYHPNIIKVYERIPTPTHFIMVTEFCERGTLKQQIGTHGLPIAVAKQKMLELLSALYYVHSNGIAHRDVKVSNLFLAENDRLVLADFGLAKRVAPGQKLSDPCGAMPYRPPEMIREQEYDPFKADVWSAGVVFFFFVAGRVPWPTYSGAAVRQAILDGDVKMPDDLDQEIADQIKWMLTPDENERPTIGEVLNSSMWGQMRVSTRPRRMSSGKAFTTYMSLMKPGKKELSEMRRSFIGRH